MTLVPATDRAPVPSGEAFEVATCRSRIPVGTSPALPGRAHDPTAARTHRIIRIGERQGVPIVADPACTGAGSWVATAIRGPPDGELSPTERTLNRPLAQARAPVERGVARKKS